MATLKHVCAEYVNFPSDGNYDLGSVDSPLGCPVIVRGIAEEDEARKWLAARPNNAGIFPVKLLSPAGQAKARRAAKRQSLMAAHA